MRRFSTSSRLRVDKLVTRSNTHAVPFAVCQPRRTPLQSSRPEIEFTETWFNSSPPVQVPENRAGPDDEPCDERTVKLGKTIRILHERLPSLLKDPLPQDILSPQISLRLFPSTHPHLPVVSGKIAYTAALWTAPVAWGCIPVVGNVKIEIISERMHRNGGNFVSAKLRQEKLIVKWKTAGKSKNGNALYKGISAGEQVERFRDMLTSKKKDDEEFCGLFIFEFDEHGRIATHTIEHSNELDGHDKTAKVISVTDWLLGRAWGKREDDTAGLALGYCETEHHERRMLMKDRRKNR